MISVNCLALAKLYWGDGPLPQGTVMLGCVNREPGYVGALLRTEAGIYVQGNAGCLRSISQAAAEQAAREMGT
jgi:hypothetical protein